MPFDERIRTYLAGAVGGVCSAPHCRVPTGIPSQPGYKENIGDGAHICGDRPGAPRFDPDQPDWERESESNGIWLCPTCHRRADRFADLHKIEMLRSWKAEAINRHQAGIGTFPRPWGFAALDSEYAKARAFLADQHGIFAGLVELKRAVPLFGSERVFMTDNTASLVTSLFVSIDRPLLRTDYPHWCYAEELRTKQAEIARILFFLSTQPQFRITAHDRTINFASLWRDGLEDFVDPTASGIVCYLGHVEAFADYLRGCLVPNFGQQSMTPAPI